MITLPPTYPSQIFALCANGAKSELRSTPISEKTTAKPSTKNTVLRKMRPREAAPPLVPARYDKNPGMSGKTHGDKNETMPATKVNHSVSDESIEFFSRK